jgi:hypothetical protein
MTMSAVSSRFIAQGQIDFYDDPKLIGPATDAVAAFFGRR